MVSTEVTFLELKLGNQSSLKLYGSCKIFNVSIHETENSNHIPYKSTRLSPLSNILGHSTNAMAYYGW